MESIINEINSLIIFAAIQSKLKNRENAIIARLKGVNVLINPNKCINYVSSIDFLRMDGSKDGIKLLHNLIDKIQHINSYIDALRRTKYESVCFDPVFFTNTLHSFMDNDDLYFADL